MTEHPGTPDLILHQNTSAWTHLTHKQSFENDLKSNLTQSHDLDSHTAVTLLLLY